MCDVSVIVPIYKGKKYIKDIIKMLEKNIEYLENGNLTNRLELVLVNDYPIENIAQNEIDSKNISVKVVINKENVGIHQSRVNGLNAASGKYILFLDQDDTISESYMMTQLEYIGKADAVLCNGIWRGNKRIYKDLVEHELASTKKGYYPQKTWLVSPGQLLIKKMFIPREWQNYILRKSGSDDAFLWLLMLRKSNSININPETVYFHNESGDNTSFNFSKMSESIKEMLDIINSHNFFEENDLNVLIQGQMIRIRRYDAYANISNNWENILEKIKCMSVNRTGNFAMYGYGIIGKKLLLDLQKKQINVDIIIDKDASCYEGEKRKCLTLEELKDEIEVMIITPIFDKEKIRKKLKENAYIKKVVMIDEL